MPNERDQWADGKRHSFSDYAAEIRERERLKAQNKTGPQSEQAAAAMAKLRELYPNAEIDMQAPGEFHVHFELCFDKQEASFCPKTVDEAIALLKRPDFIQDQIDRLDWIE